MATVDGETGPDTFYPWSISVRSMLTKKSNNTPVKCWSYQTNVLQRVASKPEKFTRVPCNKRLVSKILASSLNGFRLRCQVRPSPDRRTCDYSCRRPCCDHSLSDAQACRRLVDCSDKFAYIVVTCLGRRNKILMPVASRLLQAFARIS